MSFLFLVLFCYFPTCPLPLLYFLSSLQQRYQIAQILDTAENQGPIKSKEATCVVLAPDLKAFNYVDCAVKNMDSDPTLKSVVTDDTLLDANIERKTSPEDEEGQRDLDDGAMGRTQDPMDAVPPKYAMFTSGKQKKIYLHTLFSCMLHSLTREAV